MAVAEAEFHSSTIFAGAITEKNSVQDGLVFHKVHEWQKERIAAAFGDIPAADVHDIRAAACFHKAYDSIFT